MSDSTQHLSTITETQAGKATTANELFDPMSQAALFGRRAASTSLLTWGYYGARLYVNGAASNVPSASYYGTVALTASQTNYVEVDHTGAVSVNTTAFSAGRAPLYKVVTNTTTVTSYEDHRDRAVIDRVLYARATQAMADANKTLTLAQALCRTVELTGALTALRDVIVPLVPRQWTIYANVTGGFGVRVIGASGTGITVADGKRAIVECDGTNVVRVTADV